MISRKFTNSGLFTLTTLALMMADPVVADVAVDPDPSGVVITVTGTADPDTPDVATNCDDSGSPVTCASLREAVIYANTNGNALAGYDSITVPYSGTPYLLDSEGSGEDAAASGDLDILEPLAIEGVPDAGGNLPTIDGNSAAATDPDRVFELHQAGAFMIIRNLTIQNGLAEHANGGGIFAPDETKIILEDSDFLNNEATWDLVTLIPDPDSGGEKPDESQGQGGAIITSGTLEVDSCLFQGNTTESISTIINPDKGEVYKTGAGAAINTSFNVTVLNSTIDNNTAVDGAGLNMSGGNTLHISGTTFSNNDAISGGGLRIVSPSVIAAVENSTFSNNSVSDSGAAIDSNTSLTLTHVTIADNPKGSLTKGAGINMGSGKFATMLNTLLSNNLGDDGNVQANCGSKGSPSANPVVTVSLGGNVSTDDTCSLAQASDQENVAVASVNLAALADNGGSTETRALVLPSVAVDTGVSVGALNTDQRDESRPLDGDLDGTTGFDVGAFELFTPSADLQVRTMMVDPNPASTGENVTISISVLNPAGAAVATNTMLDIGLEAGLAAGALPAGCVAGMAPVTMTCDLGDLNANTTVEVDVTASSAAQGDYLASASVSSDLIDPVPANNTLTQVVNVVGSSDLSISASATPTSLTVGDSVTISFEINNAGPNDATNVRILGQMTGGDATLVSSTGNACSYDNASGGLSCLVGSVAMGVPAVIEVVGSVDSAGTLTVSADVTGDQTDASLTNNSVGPIDVAIAAVASSSGSSGGGGCAVLTEGQPDHSLLVLFALALGFLGLRRRPVQIRKD